ncbi:MAG TPA: hypothetical protein VJQ55_12750, partial [Candidatus Binatia bacterium]|nr:hypothetical protein [Candidatus Binatia bacterium]
MRARILQTFSRRETLKILGLGSAGFIFGRGDVDFLRAADAATKTRTAGTPPCVVRPEQTEGPYFVDEKLNRSDIRVDPSDKSV